MITTMLPMNKNHKYYAKKDTKTSTCLSNETSSICYEIPNHKKYYAKKSTKTKFIALEKSLDRANKSFKQPKIEEIINKNLL